MLHSAQVILLSILGGVLTIVVVELVKGASRRYSRRRFKNIFGASTDKYHLVYTCLVLRPEFRHLAPQISPDLLKFPLAKPHDSEFCISAERSASACEIRAASYVGPALARNLGVTVDFIDDSSVRDTLNVDFVSFGAVANNKTVDIFRNEANDLVEYDLSKEFFVWKESRQPIYQARQDGLHDYGIILKIHPTQFPGRTWIACAGIGETGTSASAYFLATKWREIEKVVKGDAKFVCLIEAEKDKDESALRCLGPLCDEPGA